MRWWILLTLFSLSYCSIGQCADSNVNYTGECGDFTDKNGDGFCDLGIVNPSILSLKHQSSKTENRKIVQQEKPFTPTIKSADNAVQSNASVVRHSKDSPYHFLEIAIPVLLLYIVNNVLVKRKVMKSLVFYRLWNVLLLFTFIVTGILGLLLTAKLI